MTNCNVSGMYRAYFTSPYLFEFFSVYFVSTVCVETIIMRTMNAQENVKMSATIELVPKDDKMRRHKKPTKRAGVPKIVSLS